MARSRNIKPGFFTNDILGELPALTRLLFAGMWTIADREGRIEDRPKKIRAEVLPYDQCDAEVMLAELEKAGFIKRYAACGMNVIQVVAWDKHQNPHVKESISTLPAPGQHQTSTVLGTTLTGASRADSLLLIPDSLKDTSPAKLPTRPTCPTNQIVEIYHEVLPELPAVRLMPDKRKKAIAGFWNFVLTTKKNDGTPRATTSDEACAWTRQFFERARDNDFLMGRNKRSDEHAGWACDLDFLMSDKGKSQVIEKTREMA